MSKKISGNWQLIILGIIIILSLCLKTYYDYYWPKAQVKIKNETFNVLVADNIKHWVKGLGGRKDLGEIDGMLFVFPVAEQHVFVMRDMKFPLDIIWVKNGEIVDMAPNVPLDPAKIEDELTPYAARDISDKVLEFGVGTIEKLHLKIGDKVTVYR